MKFKKFLLGALGLAVAASAFADGPFRAHRFDSFKVTPTEEGQIMFVGNSITNMHSWFEAFGSHQEVVGRGNSGGLTTEVLDNLESFIDSKPAKLFVMIGTNDISSGVATPELNARRVQAIVKRVRVESPETEIYLETILPRSSNKKPGYEQNNTILKNWVAELNDPKVHIINLSEVCAPLDGNGDWAYDGLHPRPIGYSAWCHEIQDEVGYPTVYPETITPLAEREITSDRSAASRSEQFPYFPVSEGDVLFYGDEQVHGAEWHELLRSNKIKDRGVKWGWGGINLTEAKTILASSLVNQPVKPAKIFLFYGIGGTNETNYRALVGEAKKQAPEAKIYLVSLSPSSDGNTDKGRVDFNKVMETVAADSGATYVDVYTPLKANIGQNIMYTNYISGRGYIVMANELAKYLTEEGVDPVSMEEANALIERRNNRKLIGDAMTKYLVDIQYGDGVGQISNDKKAVMDEQYNKLVAAINSTTLTAASAQAAAEEFDMAYKQNMNMPTASTDDNTVWYRITSSRENRSVAAENGVLVGTTPSAASSLMNDIWKLINRGDGTFDIINYNGEYISPVASYNTQMKVTETRPEKGFNISYSDAVSGYCTIYTSDAQLNQTASNQGYKVFNWYNKSEGVSTPDRNDQGCAFNFTLFEGRILDPDLLPSTGWFTIEGASGANEVVGKHIANTDEEFRQTNTNFYALEFLNEKPADKPAKCFVHITITDNTWQFTGLNGRGIKENATSDRNSLSTDNPAVAMGDNETLYSIGKWAHYPINGHVYIGKSSGSNNVYRVTRVSEETLADYDIWTVGILADQAAEVGKDLRVSLDIPENKGITSVFNGGVYFVEKGTKLTPEMITFIPAEGVTQEFETPEININDDSKSIIVKFKSNDDGSILTVLNKSFTTDGKPYRVADELAAPVLASKVNTAAFNVSLNSNPAVFGVFAGATNTAHDAKFFTHGVINDGRVGVRYIGEQGTEGWYTQGHNGGNSQVKVVIVNDPAVGYAVYVNGTVIKTIPAANLGDYGHKHFGNIEDADALYLGGIVTAKEDAKYMINGTIHSARFWDRALTAQEVANLNYDFLTESTVEPNVGIEEIGVKPVEVKGIFDLQGRRVAKPAHGLYIVNGRKVIL